MRKSALFFGILLIALVGIVSACHCGDNLINVAGETCDGSNLNGKTCIDFGFDYGTLGCYGVGEVNECTFDLSNCHDYVCGDGSINLIDEECDEGTALNGVLCSAGYDSFCEYCTSDCAWERIDGPFCGDEECQTEFENWETCSDDCSKPEVCGDGFLDFSEECDEGTALNGVLCSAGYDSFCEYCTSECLLENIDGPYCGDFICQEDYEDWISCSSDCSKDAVCGDGYLDLGESCDWAENNSLNCNPEYDSSCSYCSLNTCQIIEVQGGYCGDGYIDYSEICDDGNLINGDGCSSDCKIETSKRTYSSHIEEEDCVPNWECSAFSECIDEMQYRDCVDTNKCEYQYNEPLESQLCVDSQNVFVEDSKINPVLLIGLILAAILALILVILPKH